MTTDAGEKSSIMPWGTLTLRVYVEKGWHCAEIL
ncbi:hypothetical protein PS623_03309 [Pseudomonas fluorescens]|nr:hypothetical protein PS623_03309 [Pseudomonas fluorescens]